MKFTSIALIGAASAVQLSADPYPLTSGTADAVAQNPIRTQWVSSTGGHDSKTLQSKTAATTSVQDFPPARSEIPSKSYTDVFNGFQDGQHFQIHSAMDGGRVLYASHNPIETRSTHPVGKYEVLTHSTQYEVHSREAEGTTNEYWYWHDKTRTIRSVANGERCLTWDHAQKAL